MEQVMIRMNNEKRTVRQGATTARELKKACGIHSCDQLYLAPSLKEVSDDELLIINNGDEFVTSAPEGTNS